MAREELIRLLARAESGAVAKSAEPFPADQAALLLALDEYPHLDLASYEAQLADYAERVAKAIPAGRSASEPRERLAALRRVLFEEEAFHGDRETYQDIRNSYLNEVLDRKLGIPISLGAVMIGVARRLGWALEPVNFPSHFLLRCSQGGNVLAVDPFHGGLILGRADLVERWQAATRAPAPPIDVMLRPATPVAMVVRMLNNIWMVHANAHRYRLAALAKEKVALLEPSDPGHARDLGYLLAGAGEIEQAGARLADYLSRAPHAPDRERVQQHLARLGDRPREQA